MKSVFLSMFILCLVTMGMCIMSDDECKKIPLENIIPCKDFLTNAAKKPSDECCKGARSWLSLSAEAQKDICICYQKSPGRIPFAFENATYELVPLCGLPASFNKQFACCLVAETQYCIPELKTESLTAPRST